MPITSATKKFLKEKELLGKIKTLSESETNALGKKLSARMKVVKKESAQLQFRAKFELRGVLIN